MRIHAPIVYIHYILLYTYSTYKRDSTQYYDSCKCLRNTTTTVQLVTPDLFSAVTSSKVHSTFSITVSYNANEIFVSSNIAAFHIPGITCDLNMDLKFLVNVLQFLIPSVSLIQITVHTIAVIFILNNVQTGIHSEVSIILSNFPQMYCLKKALQGIVSSRT